MNIFNFQNYVDFIIGNIEKNEGTRGYKTSLANEAKCQKSYLSLVLKREAQFTPEHAFNICNFFKFNELESDYFCLLVDFERAGSIGLKNKVDRQLQDLLHKRSGLNRQLTNSQRVGKIQDIEYYSAWYTQAIHLATACDNYHDVSVLCSRFNLSNEVVVSTLEFLKKNGLVDYNKKKGWTYRGNHDIHISSKSKITSVIHSNWRNKAIFNSNNWNSEDLHYTSVQVHSHSDFLKIKTILSETSNTVRDISLKSECEDLYCYNIDLFKI